MRTACASAVAAAVVLAACGGSESSDEEETRAVSDEEEIRAVFAEYQHAAERGDGKTICKDTLARSQLGGESVERCARDFGRLLQMRGSQRVAAVHLSEIKIDGNHATAETDGGFVEFEREDGRWGLILFR